VTQVRLEWDDWQPMLAVHRDVLGDPGDGMRAALSDIADVPDEILDAYDRAVDAMLAARKALTDCVYGKPP
jgi:hypothetical protein